jgi:hypothetical protein
MLAALDLGTGKVIYLPHPARQTLAPVPRFLQNPAPTLARPAPVLRGGQPRTGRPGGRFWCAANTIELVSLPTNASWLSWIACEFSALHYFALAGTDHRSHTEQNAAIGAYSAGDTRAHPKTHFATNSPVRRSGYMINIAGRGNYFV